MHSRPASSVAVSCTKVVVQPKRRLAWLFAGLVVLSCISKAPAQVNVTTYHNDIGRTGQNLNETILNTSNVNSTQFGKLFTQHVDGQVYAQPLYLSGITVNGATHNVIFVATQHDSVYAFDADTNAGANASPLWQASMLTAAHGAAAGATTIPWPSGSDITPEVGITGTPVIDPLSGTLYIVSASAEGGAQVQRLHALDVTTGAEKFGGPIAIAASVPGTGNGSVNGTLSFDPAYHNQRSGLLLLNGIVYVGFASHEDSGPWHGWILGYNASTLKQTGAFCTSPNGNGSGVWMAGGGLAADQLDTVNHPYGRMFIPTGNGDYTAAKPYTSAMDYGDTHLNLDLTNGVPTVTDEFTTNQQAILNAGDTDLGSGGLMILPTLTGTNPHLLVQGGKAGTLFLLNRDNLGGYNTTTDQSLQQQAYTIGNVGVWSSPAYWNGNVYWMGQFDYLKSFPLVNGLLSTTPTKSTETYGFPGATPSISANGSSQGIVWTVDSEAFATLQPGVLQAHDASNVATTLYSSITNSARDNMGPAVKFAVPTIANGKVYIGAGGEVDIFGLLNGITQTNAPVIIPGSESFSGSLSVNITDSTPNANIYYTTNGTAATTASTLYTGPITVSSTTTINVIASAAGLQTSAQSTATFTSVSQTDAPIFSLPTGIYTAAQSVILTDATAGSSIYYTTDGSIPTTSSTLYSGPIPVSATETVSAIGVSPGIPNSPVIAHTFTFRTGQTGISFPSGFANAATLLALNGSANLKTSSLQLMYGLSGQAGTGWYKTPVNVQSFTTDFTFQMLSPLSNGITFAIQNTPQNIYALGGNGYELAYAPLTNSVAIKFDVYNSAGEGLDSTGLYLNGAVPTVPAIDLTSTGINLHSGDPFAVHLTYDGATLTMTITDQVTAAIWSTSWTVNIPSTIGSNTAYVGFTGSTGAYSMTANILSWTYFSGSGTATVAPPSFSPAAGTYPTAQTVTLSDTTAGATIYYTTNGTTPTTSSTVYTAPINVSASESISALAVAAGYANSPVSTAAYTIAPIAPTPTFSPAAGSYSTAQTVTISDTTAGATIYYTTNGTTPTTASTVYSGPITVSASETVKAIAVVTGYSNSAVASAAYSISATVAQPAFSVPSGTYSTTQTVTISDTTAGASIYYTTNGTTPTTASTVYSAPITVSSTEAINAIAVAAGYTNSAIATASYTISSSGPIINFASGMSATNLNLYGSKIVGTALQITDGATGETHVAWYTKPVNIQAFTTDFNFQDTAATAEGFTFAIQNAAAGVWAVGGTSGGLGYSGIGTSVAIKFDLYNNSGEGINSTGVYINGAAPTTPFTDMTASGVSLHSGNILHAHVTYDGTTLTLTLTDTITNASFTTSTAINIPATVGGNTAFVGFTGTTGGLTAVQSILNWTYLVGSANPTTATPTFSPAAGTYTTAQTVAISDATTGATIYYTTNGTTPTTSSSVYATPLTVTANQTISAIATSTGNANSSVASAVYTIAPLAATPTFSPAAGTFATAQRVTISDTTAGATIYYTINGTTPTTASTVYSAPVTVSATETVKAIAVATGSTNSAVGSAAYTINGAVATPTFTPVAGAYSTSQTITVNDATSGATIYYTVDGTTPTTASTVYTTPILVSATETLKAIAVKTGYTNSAVATAAYTITTPVATPTFTPAAGTYTSAQTITINDATSGATIYYTTNGTAPTTSSTLYATPVIVGVSETLNAIAVKTGYANSAVATAAYTITPPAATPTFSPAGGSYSTAQAVTISDTTPGATIYYTTNGTTPTTASAVYASPISVSSTETLNAMAVAPSYTNSSISTAAYTITPTAVTPTFSPIAGTYTTAQTVAISDSTPGATIFYTTDGTTPTSASTVYTTPIAVSVTETVKAIAVSTNYNNSAVGTAAYTISATPPVINFSTTFTATGLNLYGAKIVTGALQMTDGGSGEQRAAWYTTPVNVQKFTTDFTFKDTAATADGMTFTIQNAPAGIWSVGGNGYALGYGGISNSVAIKFDLYSNSGEGTDSTGFYVNGASPTIPSIDMTSSGVNLHSGNTMHAHITYDGTTLTLTLTDTVTNASFTTSTAINIPTTVGANAAYVGFTAGTGGLSATQNILTWTYNVN